MSRAARDPIATGMDNPAIARLEQAIDRVERALDQRSAAEKALAGRHAALKATMTQALSALDEIIAHKAAAQEENG